MAYNCANSHNLFNCLCSPVPSLAWSRNDGKRMPIGRYALNNRNSELLIRTVEKSDEGDYKCDATSSAGRDHVIIQVDVQCKFRIICNTKQNINECDIIIRQMCRRDTKAVPTALTGAIGSKNTNYNSK